MFLFGEGVEDQAVCFVEEVSQQIVGDGTLRADGVPVGLVHVIARQNVRILPAEEVALGGVELQGDVIRLVLIVQADGGEQFAADLIAAVLEEVGLGERKNNFPAQLSGGEQQRVSIARALAKNPKLLLCDEPTGALDYNTGKSILKLLQNMCREKGMTVIIITHNQALAPMADRLIHIKNGQVARMESNENPTSIDEIEW